MIATNEQAWQEAEAAIELRERLAEVRLVADRAVRAIYNGEKDAAEEAVFALGQVWGICHRSSDDA